MSEDNKTYFHPGDVVTIRQGIPNKPIMIVVKKETMTFRPSSSDEKDEYFIGIKCRWFSTEGNLQEAVYSTKDLIKI